MSPSAKSIPQLFVRLLREGYQIRSRAKGESMAPLIRRGDLLTIRPAGFAEMRAGEVVAYGSAGLEEEDTLTTHRVVKKVNSRGQSYLLTRDDASSWAGRGVPVYPAQVYGKVVKIENGTGVLYLDDWRVRSFNSVKICLVRGLSVMKGAVRACCELHPVTQRWLNRVRDMRVSSRGASPAQRTQTAASGHGSDGTPDQKSNAHAHVIHDYGSSAQRALTTRAADLDRENRDEALLNRTYRKDEDLVLERIRGELVLVPVRKRLADMERIFTLNESASRVWELIEPTRPVRDIRDYMVQEFNVPLDLAHRDLLALLNQLRELGAIHAHGEIESGDSDSTMFK